MPKKPFRNNQKNRMARTVQSAAGVLQRLNRKSGGALIDPGDVHGISLIEQWRARLPETLRPHLLQVLEKPGELVLFTDSAAWATRIRVAACEAEPAGGRRITLRVIPQ